MENPKNAAALISAQAKITCGSRLWKYLPTSQPVQSEESQIPAPPAATM
jgi:hypothetical protein